MSSSSTPPPTPNPKSNQGAKQTAQGMQLIPLLTKFFKSMGGLMAVWSAGYFGFSTAWVMIGLFVFLANDEYKKVKDAKREYARDAAVNEKQAILARVEELPSWVYFPDVEKAEWLNKMIKQMWPFVGEYMKTMLKTRVEPAVQSSLPKSLTPFRFDKIDLGDIPPRIGGVKVYTDNVKRDEIIMDLELFVISDSEISMTVRGVSAGIKDLVIHGTLRIHMRPLVRVMPIIGGLNIFFLNPPKVDFDLTNTANILDLPVLSNTLRTVVEDQIAFYMVLPNKIPVSMCDQVSLASLKYPTPQGVLQLHIVAGKELVGKDNTLIGKKKSDPYCKIFVGANSFKTKVVKETVNPVWNQYFEAVVEEKQGQVIDIELLDHDNTGDDDDLGCTSLDISTIAEQGSIDTWLPLEGVKSGMIHVRAVWMHLSKDPDDLEKSLNKNMAIRSQTGSEEHLSAALLLVSVDSAKELPSKTRAKKAMSEPSPMCKVTVANKTLQSNTQANTVNPLWEHNFEFLIHNPKLQELELEVVDTKKGENSLGTFVYSLKNLLTARDMCVNRPFHLNNSTSTATVSIRLCLRVLSSELPADWALDTGVPETLIVEDTTPGTDIDAAAAMQKESDVDQAPIPGASASVAPSPAVRTPVVPAPGASVLDEQLANFEAGVEELIVSQPADTMTASAPGTEVRQRTAATVQAAVSEPGLGKLRVTVRYSPQRNKLVLVAHNCVNLQAVEGDSDNSADPYLKIAVLPDRSKSCKRKTEVIKNNLNPVFDETFDWSMTLSEAQSKQFEITVKNEVGMFSKSQQYMGMVLVDLSQYDLTKAVTDWFPLQECEEK